MSLLNGDLSAADVAAVTGNNDFGGNGAFWIIILFLFAMMGGWNNGWNGNAAPTVEVQDGFNHQAVMSALGDISTNLNVAEVSRCNNMANLSNQINQLSSTFQNCCCENKQLISDLKYTVATESANTRQAVAQGTQTVIDKMCQQEIDALKTELANANTALQMATLRESQTAQTAQLESSMRQLANGGCNQNSCCGNFA